MNRINFLPPWVETNLQPAFYDLESGTSLQQTARMYNKVNELVRSVNTQNETIADYIQQFIDLREFCEDYFENLDVQNEINNKLDKMAQDGSLSDIINERLIPYINQINANLTEETSERINADKNLQNQINGLASGAPLKATSMSQMTDTSRIYVLTTDGNWYYYNGTSWTSGGVYQSTALGSDSVKLFNLNDNVIGNKFNYSGTTNYPLIRFNLAQRFSGTSDSPLSIDVKYRIKVHQSDKEFNFTFQNEIQNQANHTVTAKWILNNSNAPVVAMLDDYLEVNQSLTSTHDINGFSIFGNTNKNPTIDFTVEDVELLINGQKVDVIFDSAWTENENVTQIFETVTALSSKKFVREEVKKPVENYSKLKNAFERDFLIEGNFSYAGAYFKLANYFNASNDNPISCKLEFEIEEPTNGKMLSTLNNILISYGILNSTSYLVNSEKNLSDINTAISVEFNATHAFNFFRIYLNQSNATDVKFRIKNLKIFTNNELCDFILQDSEYVTDESSIDYILSNTSIDSIVNSELTPQNYDSMIKSNTHKIVCWGDSLTEGGTAEGIPYPRILNDILGEDYTVVNCGKSGERSGAIAFRQGGNVMTNVLAFTIPSNNTSVSFTAKVSSSWPQNMGDGLKNFAVNIMGVAGKINISAYDNTSDTITITFTRDENGNTVNVPVGTKIVSSQDKYDDYLNIIWMGINDVTFAYPNQFNGVISNYANMVDHLSPQIKRFLIIGTCTTASMTPSSQLYGQVVNINNFLEKYYPNQYVDLNAYASSQLIYDMGITPTSADLENMSNGIIPDSVTADHVHFTPLAREYIAQYIYNELVKRDWA